ncbi:hypothetical protein L198_03196 [Cryptococcus wingfieldii CBS 7118]|uniref:Glycosyltransferase 61 catalytic domain-containing protein n=1 Tax=Cryptococcus wingfieldii CBS 7118 TaxID=1295528 RepID=A0A1E3JET6_9TREE|nr:hypothetical protein L198_03196 [Cryptococcus wingfieldii CBS 7118]ODN99354.1 hypothetical protein L198_03196 [Cryptococcus wingfieldii CBS 7118]
MPLLFSRKALAAGLFSLTLLAIFTHLGTGAGGHTFHPSISRVGLLPSSWSSQESLYVPMEDFPETKWISGVAGFNYLHNLYMTNGTFLALTSNPSTFPEEGVSFLMSALATETDTFRRHGAAGEDRFQILSKKEAWDKGLLQPAAIRKHGISMFFNDVREGERKGSFLDHYFHSEFWDLLGEMFLGSWRATTAAGETEMPARIMYRAEGDDWVRLASLVSNGWASADGRLCITTWFQQTVMPDTVVEEPSIFEDRVRSGMTFLFDKITIADRWAAHRLGKDVRQWNKATGDLPSLSVPSNWMDPMRNRLKALGMAEGCSPQRKRAGVPVVVYINRQLTKRRMADEDAAALLVEMERLDAEGVIEFHNAQMEKLHRVQQFCLALRGDIMFGVHGNGLSHLLWMKPGSGVLEIMHDGFARDYAILAEMMGHEYYAIHTNHTFPEDQWRQPNGWAVDQGPEFHGANIRLDAKWFAGMIEKMAKARKYVTEPELY